MRGVLTFVRYCTYFMLIIFTIQSFKKCNSKLNVQCFRNSTSCTCALMIWTEHWTICECHPRQGKIWVKACVLSWTKSWERFTSEANVQTYLLLYLLSYRASFFTQHWWVFWVDKEPLKLHLQIFWQLGETSTDLCFTLIRITC